MWRRTSSKKGTRKLAAIHDVILFYGVTDESTFNTVYGDHDADYVAKFYRFEDKHGKFRKGDLTAAGTRNGDSGEPWRGIDPTGNGRHWGSPGTFPEHVEKPAHWSGLKSREKLDYLDSVGLIYWPPKGSMPAFKRYLSTSHGAAMTDMVLDVPPLAAKAKEKIGYPTQKPLALLDRIIQTSSNTGDMVLDPFAGCATACVAAEKLKRQWVGIDLSPVAASLVKSRIKQEMGLFYEIHHRTDMPRRTDLGNLPSYKTHKHTLYGKQEGIFAGCLIMFPFRNMTIDHIIPQSKGGSDHLDNLQLLCGACNSLKGTRSQEELIAQLKEAGMRQ